MLATAYFALACPPAADARPKERAAHHYATFCIIGAAQEKHAKGARGEKERVKKLKNTPRRGRYTPPSTASAFRVPASSAPMTASRPPTTPSSTVMRFQVR